MLQRFMQADKPAGGCGKCIEVVCANGNVRALQAADLSTTAQSAPFCNHVLPVRMHGAEPVML